MTECISISNSAWYNKKSINVNFYLSVSLFLMFRLLYAQISHGLLYLNSKTGYRSEYE